MEYTFNKNLDAGFYYKGVHCMYDMTDISKIKPNQYIEVMFSTTHHIKKPSSDSVAKEVHRMQIFPGKIARVALTGLTGRLEDGQLFFPGGSAKEFVTPQYLTK